MIDVITRYNDHTYITTMRSLRQLGVRNSWVDLAEAALVAASEEAVSAVDFPAAVVAEVFPAEAAVDDPVEDLAHPEVAIVVAAIYPTSS